MKKIITLLFCTLAAISFIACDTGTTPVVDDPGTDPAVDYSTYVAQLVWLAQLDGGTYAPGGVTLDAADGTVLATNAGAQQLNSCGASAPSTESYFGTGNSYRYVHDGADWGGIFAKFAAMDMSAYTSIKIALKGVPADLADLTLEIAYTDSDPAPMEPVNLISYVAGTDGDWTIYTVPFSEFLTVDFAQWAAAGLWHPKDSAGAYVVTDMLMDVAFE